MIRRLILAALLVGCTAFVGARAWIAQAPSGGAPAFTTFDPANDLQAVTLTGSNLIATSGTCPNLHGATVCGARGTSPTTHGSTDKVRFQFTIGVSGSAFSGLGIQSATFDPSASNNLIGYDSLFGAPHSTLWSQNATGFVSAGVGLGFAGGACFQTAGNIADIVWDFGNARVWGDCWNGSAWVGWNNGAGNPDAGTGSYTFNNSSGPYFIGFGASATGASYTLNVGATAFQSNVNVTSFSAWH